MRLAVQKAQADRLAQAQAATGATRVQLVTIKARVALEAILEMADVATTGLAQPEQAAVVAVAVTVVEGLTAARVALVCLALALMALLEDQETAAEALAEKMAQECTAEDLAVAEQVGIHLAAAAEHCVTLTIYLSPPEKP